MTDRPRWWLMGMAALMAAIFLYESIGLAWAIALFAGSIAAFAGYRLYRSRKPAPSRGVRCLTCGEALASTARECKYCGSTRWTVN